MGGVLSGLDWPLPRNHFISEIQTRLKTAAVLEKREAVAPGLVAAVFGRSRLLQETCPPGVLHVPRCAPSLRPSLARQLRSQRERSRHVLACFVPVASLWGQPSMPLKWGFGQKERPCVASVLNVKVKRKLTTRGRGQNSSCTTGHLCDCSR